MMGLDAIPTTSKLVAAPRIKPTELTECFRHLSLLYDCLGMPDTSLSFPQLSQQLHEALQPPVVLHVR